LSMCVRACGLACSACAYVQVGLCVHMQVACMCTGMSGLRVHLGVGGWMHVCMCTHKWWSKATCLQSCFSKVNLWRPALAVGRAISVHTGGSTMRRDQHLALEKWPRIAGNWRLTHLPVPQKGKSHQVGDIDLQSTDRPPALGLWAELRGRACPQCLDRAISATSSEHSAQPVSEEPMSSWKFSASQTGRTFIIPCIFRTAKWEQVIQGHPPLRDQAPGKVESLWTCMWAYLWLTCVFLSQQELP
jgi:hypothetical protein